MLALEDLGHGIAPLLEGRAPVHGDGDLGGVEGDEVQGAGGQAGLALDPGRVLGIERAQDAVEVEERSSDHADDLALAACECQQAAVSLALARPEC